MKWDRQTLRRSAGSQSFSRGEAYFKGGKVSALAEHEGTLAAKVRGTQTYRAKLWVQGGKIRCLCTCPLGQDGTFCKHGVAMGLAWLGRKKHAGKPPLQKAEVTLKDVRAWLAAQGKDALADLLMEQAQSDEKLRRRFLFKVAKKSRRGSDLNVYRKAIDQAVQAEPQDYPDIYDYASDIGEAIQPIEGLLKEGRASEALELAEYALEAIDGIMGSVNDSYGHMGNLTTQLREIHLKACRKAKPDPVSLAERLFTWELQDNWGTFHGTVEAYKRILGKEGLAAYRQLAKDEWAKPVSQSDLLNRNGRHLRVTRILENMAKISGDVEALVDIKKHDLSSPWSYLQIAQAYKKAGKPDAALEWAERGAKAFPRRTDYQLIEFLADEYHRRKRHDEAMAMVWKWFAETPSLETYQALKRHADRAGKWKEWRPKALDFMRQQTIQTKSGRKDAQSRIRLKDHTEIVRVLLWEKNVEAAWKEARQGCSDALWLQLAEKRGNSHPADALPVYQRLLGPTVGGTNKEAYKEGIALLKKIRELMARMGRETKFGRYLESVRADHKQKRNFIKMIDQGKWS